MEHLLDKFKNNKKIWILVLDADLQWKLWVKNRYNK